MDESVVCAARKIWSRRLLAIRRHGHAHIWKKTEWLIKEWKRNSGGKPFLLKGIQGVANAGRSVEIGCDGIVVNNHAGRQVDGAIASLDALEKIVDAVGDRIVVS